MIVDLDAIERACHCCGPCTDRACDTQARVVAGTFGLREGGERWSPVRVLTVDEWRARQTEAAA